MAQNSADKPSFESYRMTYDFTADEAITKIKKGLRIDDLFNFYTSGDLRGTVKGNKFEFSQLTFSSTNTFGGTKFHTGANFTGVVKPVDEGCEIVCEGSPELLPCLKDILNDKKPLPPKDYAKGMNKVVSSGFGSFFLVSLVSLPIIFLFFGLFLLFVNKDQIKSNHAALKPYIGVWKNDNTLLKIDSTYRAFYWRRKDSQTTKFIKGWMKLKGKDLIISQPAFVDNTHQNLTMNQALKIIRSEKFRDEIETDDVKLRILAPPEKQENSDWLLKLSKGTLVKAAN